MFRRDFSLVLFFSLEMDMTVVVVIVGNVACDAIAGCVAQVSIIPYHIMEFLTTFHVLRMRNPKSSYTLLFGIPWLEAIKGREVYGENT